MSSLLKELPKVQKKKKPAPKKVTSAQLANMLKSLNVKK
jgi:DNA topoisomerase VI subunit B